MTRRKWLWAALVGIPVAVVGGLAYANNLQTRTFICPITGEELPCSKCCRTVALTVRSNSSVVDLQASGSLDPQE